MTNLKEKIFLPIVALLLLSLINTIPIPKVLATRTIDDAVWDGLGYMDRHYNQISSTRSVCMDYPAIPLRIQRSDSKWSIIGKLTGENYEANPKPYQDICGGGSVRLISMESRKDRYLFSFDIDGDSNYGDVEIDVTYEVGDNAYMTLEGTVTKYVDKGYSCDLWVALTKVCSNIHEGSQFSTSKQYGWVTGRYVNRHATKMLGELYNYMVSEHLYNWEQIQNEGRVSKLVDHFYDAGYTYDYYDAMFKKSNDGRSDYPSSGIGTTPYKYGWIITSHTYPDPEMWNNNPLYCDAYHFAYPYKSRLGYYEARNLYLNGGGMFPSTGGLYPVVKQGYSTEFGRCVLTELQWAIHLMHRYGNQYPYNQQAKTYIQNVLWDTWGIRGQLISGIYSPRWFSNTHTIVPLAVYLSALVSYYDATGDNCWLSNGDDDAYLLDRADKVAGILMALQVKWGDWIHIKDNVWIDKPDHIGGFISAYGLGSFTFDNSHGSGFIANTVYSFLDRLGFYKRDPEMTASVTATTTESTIPSLMALMYYKQELGRTPTSWQPNNVLPNVNAEVTVDKGGGVVASGDATKSGLIFSYIITSPYDGTAWFKTTWKWTQTLPQTVHDINFSAKFHCKGWFCGQNKVYVFIRVRNAYDQVIFQYYEIILQNWSGTKEETWVIIPDATITLGAGTYTFEVQVSEYVYQCSTGSEIDWTLGPHYGWLEYFGYDSADD